MQAWGGVSIDNVAASAGDLTQLYPNFLQAGIGTDPTLVLTRRRPNEGVIGRIEVVPEVGVGGTLEIWDVAGELTGTNDVNAGTTITDAYLQTAITAKKARLLWTVTFDGDSSATNKIFGTRTVFVAGLAARYTNPVETAGTVSVDINLVVDGGYQLWEGNLPE